MFTPPQVMTAAGAERLVKLTAVSQTEQQELTLFEIPIEVLTVRELYVNIESSIGTQRPETSVTLRYSLEHKGNVDLGLVPSFDLPSGWSVTTPLTPIDLPWATSKNLLYTLEAGKNARSGDIVLNLDNGSTRFMWEGQIEVELLPEPELTFVGLEFANGRSFGVTQADGSHPSGESMTFTWLLSNAGATSWSPSASVQLDSGLFGECSPVESVGMNEVVPVVCTVVIAANMPPMSEPSFTLLLSGGGVDLTTTVGLLVAVNEQMMWDVGNVPLLTTGEERQVTVKITNTGNTAFQRQLVLNVPDGWTASVDGDDIIDLTLGESALVRINVRADTPGSTKLGFALSQSPSSTASYTIDLRAEGEPIGTSGSAGLSTTVALALFGAILLVAFAALGVQAMRGRENVSSSKTGTLLPPLGASPPAFPVPATAYAQPQASPVATPSPQPSPHAAGTPPPLCWTCRQPVQGAVLGCPSCGARYHDDGAGGCKGAPDTVCVNCQASAEHFVQA